jgi:flavorubredoxin
VDEVADGIYRLSTLAPDIGPDGFTFNQFLIDAEEPLLFHTGHRSMFSSVTEAIASVLPVERRRQDGLAAAYEEQYLTRP